MWVSKQHPDPDGNVTGPLRGLVISCLKDVPSNVWWACDKTGWRSEAFHVGYHPARNQQFQSLLLLGKKYLDKGAPVVFHCLAGVHRAALSWCLFLMFYLGVKFNSARTILENLRQVDIGGIVNENRMRWSDKEDHMLYIPDWENDAYQHVKYRVQAPTRAVACMAPPAGPPTSTSASSSWRSLT